MSYEYVVISRLMPIQQVISPTTMIFAGFSIFLLVSELDFSALRTSYTSDS